MKWIAKYDFFDLYKVKVNDNTFNPGSAITIRNIIIPYENTIIMGAEKDEHSFDSSKKSSIAVLFVSNDKGKSYQEIKTGEKDLEYMESKSDHTLIKAYTMDSLAVKHFKILLLNNKTFELKKVDEYAEPEDFSNYYYSDFDGKYIVLENFGKYIIINLLDKNEYYSIPVDEIGKSYFYIGNGKIVYKKNQEIIEYDVKSRQSKILSVLKNKYEYFRYIDENLLLKKIELEDGDKYKYGIYDIYENKLYEETNENKYFYRYKNLSVIIEN
ncbi:hypothetical protein PGH12_15235 [Chryseobacterium wangxinyae]|uniref:hypothetical protein n=1 Tax=Chryseobacterium sp. CY350 TaxID=2997336 RepID=UPI00226EAE88|nr:hypothetical protein [Chryseobacterium sp. CY350]MCY0977717.1 hypothetical protein [Chryseobacterium sp. CY350]WBZ94807.1 hypothetical protein PGH12_15235 [Chryseobacterium sp. CY350]